MTLRDAIARANAALDWIEQRDGPLKPDGYARVEATVAEVRAWGQAMSSDNERISEIRARLEAATKENPLPWRTTEQGQLLAGDGIGDVLSCCNIAEGGLVFVANAPADMAYLLNRLDALAAENETAWQTLARERDSWQAEAAALTAERDYLSSCFDELMKAGKSQRDRADKAESERDALAARAERAEAVIADAVSVGEMQGEDFRLQPWSTLRAALAASGEGE